MLPVDAVFGQYTTAHDPVIARLSPQQRRTNVENQLKHMVRRKVVVLDLYKAHKEFLDSLY